MTLEQKIDKAQAKVRQIARTEAINKKEEERLRTVLTRYRQTGREKAFYRAWRKYNAVLKKGEKLSVRRKNAMTKVAKLQARKGDK